MHIVSTINEIRASTIDAEPLVKINEGDGQITLPALSVNKIGFNHQVVSGISNSITVDNNIFLFPNPSSTGISIYQNLKNGQFFRLQV